MKGGLEMKVQGSKTRKAAPAAECKEVGNQKGSLLLEAIVVLGMIATFTPMLYKHVADRRADIENINRANTLLYLQHKAEDYLKDPDNITALVEELGHNQHKEIYPSEMGAGSNFDGRYIVGIRREDENNKPVLKAMIIDTVHTGSDLRAAKVAELIGISAGIYTAVDPDAAWGINGIWSEPLSRYFDTTNIPTGAVAITTEYNKAKYRVNISDILVDADLDMGEFEVTAEQINAVRIAAENGTLDQLIAQDVNAATKVTSPKLVATEKLCVGGEAAENCIESWEGLGGGDNALTEYQLIINCNMGDESSCQIAYVNNLNRTCSSIKDIFTRAGFGNSEGATPVYSLTYGTGDNYEGYVRTQCGGTQFVVDNISTPNLSNSVEQVGDSAFGITQPGWYQITLMGEMGWQSFNNNGHRASGGILTTNKHFLGDEILTIKAIKGGAYLSAGAKGGAGVALWDSIVTTGVPTLVAGGGAWGNASGGGYNGGAVVNYSNAISGYSWDGTIGTNTTYCDSASCNIGATGGRWWTDKYNQGGHGGTGYCGSGYTCTTITGGNGNGTSGDPGNYTNYLNSSYGNWETNTLTGGKGYASIRWCGPSGSASSCPDTCSTDSDCSGATPYCNNGFCGESCTSDSQCPGTTPYCIEGFCEATKSCTSSADCTLAAQPYCFAGLCSSEQPCLIASDCPSSKPYCNRGACSTTQILTCDSTSTMATDTWVAGWANCTTCPAGTFKHYKSLGEGGNTNYPIASTSDCVSIPAVNSYTTMPTGAYYTQVGWVSSLNVGRRQVNITCNGKNEEWDVIGPYIVWWEAQEVCAKLGKKMPYNNASLTGGCTEGARRTLIANAVAVGTGQTLKEINGISLSQYWDSSTGNTTSSAHCIYTNQTNGTNAAQVFLMSGGGTYGRSDAYISCSILCGPAN